MIVELAGLPGAGKSTFARALVARAGFTLIRVEGKKEILSLNMRFMLRYPVRFVRLLGWTIIHLGPRTLWYEKFVNLFLVHNAKFIKAKSFERAVIDQGHMQNVVSLFEKQMSNKELKKYLQIIPAPDHTVLFAVGSVQRKERLVARGHSAREHMSEEYRTRWEEQSEMNWESVLLLHLGNMFVMHTVKSDTDADDLASWFIRKPELYYILNARMPTEKAYGNQSVIMCQEFAKQGARVELWAPLRKNVIHESVEKYYQTKSYVAVRMLRSHEFSLLKHVWKKLGFYLDGLAFLYELNMKRFPSNAIAYTRKPEVAWILSRRGVRVVYECHEWFANFRTIQLRMIRSLEKLVVTNRFIKKQFVDAGISETKIYVAPNGVDMNMFALDLSKADAIHALGLEKHVSEISERSVLLYTGSFTTMGEDKGISDILHALTRLKDSDVVFLAVGGGEGDIEVYRKQAKELGVESLVHFFPRVEKDKLALFQRAADILLMPFPRKAHYEYFMSPLKTFEYMASNRPIIASDLPSIREVLDPASAYFSQPGNTENLATIISQIVAHPEEANKKAQHARERCTQFTWENRAKTILAEIDKFATMRQ